MEKAPRTLTEILQPGTTEQFFERHLGQTFHYYPGRAGKFAALLPWGDLNQLLRHHQLDSPRLRLARDGKGIPPESFISYHESRRGAPRLTRLRPTDLTRHLQEGATLILDGVDELFEPITELAGNLEQALRARIQVNTYAGGRTSPGFDVHWDGHDVFVLQVSGRKHWKVYPMTREHPLPGDPKTEKPPETALWEGMLEDGDLLYIPRGWWHVAVPLNEPTLHLTVGVHQLTGLDFLSWYADRLRTSISVRQDLPRLGTAADKEMRLKSIRDVWEQGWNPGLLDEYFADVDSRAPSRPHFGLPWTAGYDVLPPADVGWSAKWLVPRPIEWAGGGQDPIVVRAHGKELTFAAAARPVLEILEKRGTCSLEELYAAGTGTLTRESLQVFVKELVDVGVVSIAVNGSPPIEQGW
jgi:hypothetical protein